MDRLLIISNNVLSETTNNGKTLFSFIDSISRKNIKQLYFSSEIPRLKGYDYFRISDKDVIKGKLLSSRRGAVINPQENEKEVQIEKRKIPRTTVTCLLREIVWGKGWKSQQLIDWLDDYYPTIVFFHAGDCIFAHNIYRYIVARYKPRSCVYITDDYVMPCSDESFLDKFRRLKISESLRNVITHTDVLFTVSENMRKAYLAEYSVDSTVIVNMTESLYCDEYRVPSSQLNIIYAGSLYFGREEVMKKVAETVELLNQNNKLDKELHLNIYTNNVVDEKTIKKSNYIHLLGKIDKNQLIKEYNKSDILLFVESFDKVQAEKTRYSLSTKVPEYLSLKKPILAVGPDSIASIQYLRDVSACVTDENDILHVLERLVKLEDYRRELADSAFNKYNMKHTKSLLQDEIVKKIYGRE